MFFVLASVMFVAACIVAVGYAGRAPRDRQDPTHKNGR
jgi:hypothetical protein